MSTLNKNDDWTELDEQFKDLMQEMMEESPDFYDEPKNQVDYSFLHKSSVGDKDDNVTRLNIDVIKYRKKFRSFASRIAIFALCILVTGSGIAIWINSQQASALKFQAEKKFYAVQDGTFSTDPTEQNEGKSDERCITRKYKSMKDIDKAKEFMPDLPIPGYVPEEFALESLIIEKNPNNIMTASFNFQNADKKIFINILDGNDETGFEIQEEVKIINDGDNKIYLWKEKSTGSYGCSCIINEKAIYIMGDISENEMINIVENLK